MDERYPVGSYEVQAVITPAQREAWIAEIERLPEALRASVNGWTPDQLDIPYREGGWSSRQVVHHLADSHMNSYIRFKLALTEESPTIRPYYEDRWARLGDYKADIEVSLSILTALHARWVILLRAMTDEDFKRPFHHPESGQTLPLDYHLGVYAWHGRHHTAHIHLVRAKLGLEHSG